MSDQVDEVEETKEEGMPTWATKLQNQVDNLVETVKEKAVTTEQSEPIPVPKPPEPQDQEQQEEQEVEVREENQKTVLEKFLGWFL